MPETLDQMRADTAGFTFKVDGADDTELKVVGFKGREGISRLFSFEVELASDNAQIDLYKMVGQACTLAIAGDDGTRYVQGIVRLFQRAGRGAHYVHYKAEIVPQVWLLTRRYGSRIFQTHNCPDMTIPGIVRKVLIDAGIADDRFRFVLHHDYKPREYVVQYRETDMDFISRLMEEEGIFYYFEHTADGHVLVMGDSASVHTPGPLSEEYPYSEPTGLVAERQHIFEFIEQRKLGYGAVRLDDFNFTKPQMELDVTAGGQDYQSLLWDDVPGEYQEKELGQTYANTRLEEYMWRKHTIECAATARGLVAGYTFKMTDHPTAAANREYLAVNVEHRGSQPQTGQEEGSQVPELQYEARLITIPADVPFRPCRCTKCPKIQGAQTAVVVGPKNEEIYVDKYARVKVQFHWDKEGCYDENSSRWIRVSQVWAGGEYGAMFTPRVGHEVIVEFLEGDPDQPIIVGRVHNGDLMPTFDPSYKHCSGFWTQSTKGGGGCNVLVFDDEKDEEQVYMHSQKDLELTAENDYAEHFGQDSYTVIDRDRVELIKSYHQAEIKLDHDEIVGGNKSRKIGGSFACSVGGAHAESCGSYWLSAGKGEVVIESSSAITLKVGGNFVKVHGGGVDIMGAVVNINSGGSAGNGCGAPFGEFYEVYEAEYAEPPGYDVSYNKNCDTDSGGEQTGDDAADETPEDKKETSWIEIELVDEAGQPWPNEQYEIKTTDGKTITGTLDAEGYARVALSEDGVQQISFPKLDQNAWARA